MSEPPKDDRPKPAVINPKIPRQSGRILDVSEMTEYELSVMAALGHDGESPVPADLAHRMPSQTLAPETAAALDAAAQALPAGYEPPTKDLDLSNITKVEDDGAVAAAMERYTNIVGSLADNKTATTSGNAFEQARVAGIEAIEKQREDAGLHPEMAAAVKQLNDPAFQASITPDEKPEESAESDKAVKVKTPEEMEAERKAFWQSKVTQEDCDSFRLASQTLRLFTKTYIVLGGAVEITFSDMTADDYEDVVRQEFIDIHIKNRVDAHDTWQVTMNSKRYYLACMLRQVRMVAEDKYPVKVPLDKSIGDFLRTIPTSEMKLSGVEEGDTPIRVWQRFLSTGPFASSLHAVVSSTYEKFRTTLSSLQGLATYPDFFGVPTKQG